MTTVEGHKFILMNGRLEKITKVACIPPSYIPTFGARLIEILSTRQIYSPPPGYIPTPDEAELKFPLCDVVYIKYES